ncbi:MAG: protein kinase family protein [Candidatus Nanopelagicales bacterium]
MNRATSLPTAGLTLLTRYVLDDLTGSDDGAAVWRGTDTRLRRPVSVLLLALEDPRADEVRAEACRAATFSDRRAISVLDVGDDDAAQSLVVVSEWAPAVGFGDYLAGRGGEPLAASEALDVTLELARVLAAAHARGLTHGRLRPNSLAVTDSGEVRLRGLGTSAALARPSVPGGLGGERALRAESVASDVEAVGSILYAGLTGRWPGGREDHLAPAARLPGGGLPWPSRVVTDVPAPLDEIAARCLPDCALPRGRTRFTDLSAVTAALGAAVAQAPPPPAPRSRSDFPWGRAIGVALAVIAVVTAGVVGVNLASGPLTRTTDATPRNTGSIGLGLVTSGAPTATPSVPQPGTSLPIVGAKSLDPYGDSQENPYQVKYAIDGNLATAWTTNAYPTANMGGKAGVGLLLDLGAARPFSTLKLVLVGNGTNLTLMTGTTVKNAPQGFATIATVTGAPNELTIRLPRPVTSRFVVIWLTKLPPSNNKFQGGIADVTISS